LRIVKLAGKAPFAAGMALLADGEALFAEGKALLADKKVWVATPLILMVACHLGLSKLTVVV
jgi:hypothetical protein